MATKRTIEIEVTASNNTGDELSGVGNSLSKIGTVAAGLGAAAAGGAIALGGAVTSLALDAANLEPARLTFQNLSADIGTTADALLTTMTDATNGMVNNADLIGAANTLVGMGLAESADEAGRLAEMAVALGGAMGGEATESIENFSAMLANSSLPRLDSFGISSGAATARINELIASGQAASREDAFKMAVLELGASAMERMGDTSQTLSGDIARTKAQFDNTKLAIGEAFIPVLASLADLALPAVNQAMGAIIPVAENVAAFVGETLPQALEAGRLVFDQVTGFLGERLNIDLPDALAFMSGKSGEILPEIQGLFSDVLQDNIGPLVETVTGNISGWWAENSDDVQETVGIVSEFLSTTWAAISEFISEHMDSIELVFDNTWEAIRLQIDTVMAIIGGIIETVMAVIQGDWEGAWEALSTTASTIWANISSLIGLAIENIETAINLVLDALGVNWDLSFSGLLTSAATTWGEIKTAIITPIEEARETIRGIIEAIQGFIDGIKIPHIPTPHINIWTTPGALGIPVPHVDVQWYGTGLDAIIDRPTLIGVGEAGPERVQVTPTWKQNGQGGGQGGNTINIYATYRERQDPESILTDLKFYTSMP